MHKRPIIGLTPLWDEERNREWMLPEYFQGIMAAGGVPVMLPLAADEAVTTAYAKAFDGFLFTGGPDVAPAYYGEEILPECAEIYDNRDAMELLLFKKAIMEQGKPAFGICRGIQLINVALGGTLYQDLPSQKGADHAQKTPHGTPMHTVDVMPDTPLFGFTGESKIAVNSYHHQAIKDIASKLMAMAVTEDGIIEAAYAPNENFIWAVQWHPERWLQNEVNKKLFNAFIKACS
jgi:putative glutamine amidotransferase